METVAAAVDGASQQAVSAPPAPSPPPPPPPPPALAPAGPGSCSLAHAWVPPAPEGWEWHEETAALTRVAPCGIPATAPLAAAAVAARAPGPTAPAPLFSGWMSCNRSIINSSSCCWCCSSPCSPHCFILTERIPCTGLTIRPSWPLSLSLTGFPSSPAPAHAAALGPLPIRRLRGKHSGSFAGRRSALHPGHWSARL